MKLIQVELLVETSKDPKVQGRMITWVENDPRVKVGSHVELKEYPYTLWEVAEKYSTEIEASSLDMNRGFDNNDYSKHEGLGVKKRDVQR